MLRYFLFSVLLGRSEVVYVGQVAESFYFFFVCFGSFVRLSMIWRASDCLRSWGCILVAHVVQSDSESS